MTLILANRQGLWADRRCIHGSDTVLLTNNVHKINNDARPYPTFTIAGAGLQNTDDRMLNYIGHLTSVMGFYRWFTRTWSNQQYAHATGPMYNLVAMTQDVVHSLIKAYVSESVCQSFLVVHRFGSTEVSPETLDFQDSLATLALGSGSTPALVLDKAGFSGEEVMRGVAKIDTMISREFDFTPRDKLYAYFPYLIFKNVYKFMQEEKLIKTEDDYRWLFIFELFNINMFIGGNACVKKGKMWPTDAALRKGWLQGNKIAERVCKAPIEEIKVKLHELYSI